MFSIFVVDSLNAFENLALYLYLRYGPIKLGVELLSLFDPCGGGLEYFHHSPKRRRKGNSELGGITWPPCSWGI
jgi:hypothetical protein